jgi:hypothetical protein
MTKPSPVHPWNHLWLAPNGTWRIGALVITSLAIASVYLPTVFTNFDFADDGATAHPVGVASIADFHCLVWDATYGEFQNKGPCRPIAWYFWIGQQEYCAGNPLGWRAFRFVWTALAAGVLLWLLQEMGFGAGVSVLTTMAAMWNPYRAEVWLSATFCEGIAMPFALTALVCAYRGPRSRHAWLWDLAGMAAALAAIGCKNVFAVVVPTQMFLRICSPDLTFWEGLKQYGWRSAMLGLVLMFPVIHFICYRLTIHSNSYEMAWESRQPLRMLNALLGSAGKDFLGPAIVFASAGALWSCWRGPCQLPGPSAHARFRAAFGAGCILFVLGWGVYLPMSGVAGRYTLPGVWGLDLLCALLWNHLARIPSPWQKVTWILLGCGLAISAVANVGKQEKNSARIATLWEALGFIEREVPSSARIAWIGVPDRQKTEELEISEGVHFHWHLRGRGRCDLQWANDPNQSLLDSGSAAPDFLITSSVQPPADGPWKLLRECRRAYWFGSKLVACCVWQKEAAAKSER